MFIRVMVVPELIPCSMSRQCFLPDEAPPERIRKVWVGQEFFADIGASGYYRYELDKDAKVQKLVVDEDGERKIVPPKVLKRHGEGRPVTFFILTIKEAVEILRAAKVDQFAIEWYSRSWEKDWLLIFKDSEVSVIHD